jgi:hypothetical protein
MEAADAATYLMPMFLHIDTTMLSPNVPKTNNMWSTTHNINEEEHHTHIARRKTQIFILFYDVARVSPFFQ